MAGPMAEEGRGVGEGPAEDYGRMGTRAKEQQGRPGQPRLICQSHPWLSPGGGTWLQEAASGTGPGDSKKIIDDNGNSFIQLSQPASNKLRSGDRVRTKADQSCPRGGGGGGQ